MNKFRLVTMFAETEQCAVLKRVFVFVCSWTSVAAVLPGSSQTCWSSWAAALSVCWATLHPEWRWLHPAACWAPRCCAYDPYDPCHGQRFWLAPVDTTHAKLQSNESLNKYVKQIVLICSLDGMDMCRYMALVTCYTWAVHAEMVGSPHQSGATASQLLLHTVHALFFLHILLLTADIKKGWLQSHWRQSTSEAATRKSTRSLTATGPGPWFSERSAVSRNPPSCSYANCS